MNAIQCSSCGLVNSPSDSSCDRCGAPLSAGRPVALHGNSTGAARSRIHGWDAISLTKALIVGSAVECVAIAPLAYYGMGHAGPHGGVLGLLSFLFNLPGFWLFVSLESVLSLDTSWAGTMAGVFLLQAVTLCYILFVLFRLREVGRRAVGKAVRGDYRRRAVPLMFLAVLVFVACLGLIVRLAESGSDRSPAGCDKTVVSRATSPDGKYVATAYHRRCQDSLFTVAEVKEVTPHFWSAPVTPLGLFPTLDGLRPVTFRWEGPSRLVVVTPDIEQDDPIRRGFFQDIFWKDVHIHYE